MKVQTFSFSDCNKQTYDVNYHSLDFGGAPVHGMLCSIDPLARSRIHNHFEPEFFLFISGTGVVHIDNQEIAVSAGMGVRAPAYSNHIIENKSADEPLRFVSFYWENSLQQPEAAKTIEANTTVLVFSTPPTPNGDLHLGHLSGPYLAADIFNRYVSQSGETSFHVTGRDDHQTYVRSKSLVEQTSPQAIADTFSKQIRDTLNAYGIHLNFFIEPNTKNEYGDFVKRIFKKLFDLGYIVEKNEPATFSADGSKYLNEAFIRGKCPYCQRESDGNACEECGRPNTCVDLTEKYERLTQQTPQVRSCKRLYFRMSLFEKQLLDYIKSTPMSAHALSVSHTMIKEGLPDICVSHPGTWGIPVPVSNFEDQTIYVWFEMAAGYLWAALNLAPKEITDEKEKIQWLYQRNNSKVVHFYGFDNTFYHTLLFPAVYYALGGLTPPSAHIVNELLDLEGSKFSTSRGHLIWGRDLLQKAPVDYIRWFLCEVRPEGVRSNFMLMHFVQSANQVFFNTLNQWTKELNEKLVFHFEGKIPESGAWTPEQRQFYNFILSCHQQVLSNYSIENFSPRSIVRILKDLSITSLHFLRSQAQYYEKVELRDNLRTVIALSCLSLKMFALLARPIIPTVGQELLAFLNSDKALLTDTAFVLSQTQCQTNLLPKFVELHEKDIASILNKKNETALEKV